MKAWGFATPAVAAQHATVFSDTVSIVFNNDVVPQLSFANGYLLAAGIIIVSEWMVETASGDG